MSTVDVMSWWHNHNDERTAYLANVMMHLNIATQSSATGLHRMVGPPTPELLGGTGVANVTCTTADNRRREMERISSVKLIEKEEKRFGGM